MSKNLPLEDIAILEVDLKEYFEMSRKFPTELIEGWLIYRGHLSGTSPMITFQMIDPRTDQLGIFHIYNNKAYSFNKKGLSPAGFKPGGNRRFMFDTFMEKIKIPSKNKKLLIKRSLREGLIKVLGTKKDLNIQISHVYKLRYEETGIDILLEQIFWYFYKLNKSRWKFHWNNNRNPVLKRLYEFYKSKNHKPDRNYKDSDLFETRFTFYLNDQSTKIQNIKTSVEKNKIQVYCSRNFLLLYKLFRQINHSNMVKLKTAFSFNEMLLYASEIKIGKIARHFSNFVNESNKDGITRAVAAVIQHEELRSEITKLTKYHPFFKQLDLSEQVFSDDKWGRVVTNQRNTIDFPDIVTYNKNSLLAQEKIQLKVLPHSPTKYLKYRYEEILSDYLKSIGCHDPRTDTGLISLRIEYLPPMTYLPSLGKLPSKDHTILIHYWGRMNKRFQRLGEIYNAIRLAIFNYNITEKKIIVEFVKENLSKGSEMLSGR
ncbi:MAG: hypothetical protein ACFE95_17385 [Candidatus Hodarchaeota archaeon]